MSADLDQFTVINGDMAVRVSAKIALKNAENVFLELDTDGNLKTTLQKTNKAFSLVADVTNGQDGTHGYYIDVEDYDFGALQSILSGGSGTVTQKIYGTIQNDGTAQEDCEYEQIDDLFGGNSSGITASDIQFADTSGLKLLKYIKIIITANSGANDADWKIYASLSV